MIWANVIRQGKVVPGVGADQVRGHAQAPELRGTEGFGDFRAGVRRGAVWLFAVGITSPCQPLMSDTYFRTGDRLAVAAVDDLVQEHARRL